VQPTRVHLRYAGRQVDLTPPPGTRLAGYLARGEAVATSALDPLLATLVRLRDSRPGGGEVTWVAIDTLAIDEGQASAIADAVASASGGPRDSVIVCASHTHSAPRGWILGTSIAFPEPGDPGMRAEMVRRIADAAGGLSAAEVPVRTVLAVGETRGVGTNRADPAGPREQTVGAFCVVDGRGAVRAVVLDHASHPTVLGHANMRWSADWPGAARRTLAAELQHGIPFPPETAHADPAQRTEPVVAFLQGAAGDASPRFVRRSQDPSEVERIGGVLAAQALTAILGAGSPVGTAPGVSVRRTRITVPTRQLPDPAVARRQAEHRERAWRTVEARDGAGTPAERIARTQHEGALIAARMAETGLPASFELPISLVVVGDDAWIHLPVELYASLAAEIRAASPFRQTRVIGYTDGYFGYVVDEAAHRIGGYEVSASVFDAAGGRCLVEASIALLRRAHDDLRRSGDSPDPGTRGA
jgi:hypothetical protein